MILLKQILVATDFSDASNAALAHGRAGLERLLLGSVAETVVRTAPCPVLTVRHPEHDFVVPDTPPGTAHDEAGGLS